MPPRRKRASGSSEPSQPVYPQSSQSNYQQSFQPNYQHYLSQPNYPSQSSHPPSNYPSQSSPPYHPHSSQPNYENQFSPPNYFSFYQTQPIHVPQYQQSPPHATQSLSQETVKPPPLAPRRRSKSKSKPSGTDAPLSGPNMKPEEGVALAKAFVAVGEDEEVGNTQKWEAMWWNLDI